jgi:hypothetical protein
MERNLQLWKSSEKEEKKIKIAGAALERRVRGTEDFWLEPEDVQ